MHSLCQTSLRAGRCLHSINTFRVPLGRNRFLCLQDFAAHGALRSSRAPRLRAGRLRGFHFYNGVRVLRHSRTSGRRALSGHILRNCILLSSHILRSYCTFLAPAPQERIHADLNLTARGFDVCQAAAIPERFTADVGHTVRNFDTRQAAAIPERFTADTGHTVRNFDTRQAAASFEGLIPNTGHTFGDCDALQAAAVLECPFADAGHTGYIRSTCTTAFIFRC